MSITRRVFLRGVAAIAALPFLPRPAEAARAQMVGMTIDSRHFGTRVPKRTYLVEGVPRYLASFRTKTVSGWSPWVSAQPHDTTFGLVGSDFELRIYDRKTRAEHIFSVGYSGYTEPVTLKLEKLERVGDDRWSLLGFVFSYDADNRSLSVEFVSSVSDDRYILRQYTPLPLPGAPDNGYRGAYVDGERVAGAPNYE